MTEKPERKKGLPADYKGATPTDKPETLAEELHRIVQDKTPEDVVRRMMQPQPKGNGPVNRSV